MNLDERAVLALERMAVNFPEESDIRINELATDTILAGTSLTVRWFIRPDFTIWIMELYADARDGINYLWDYGRVVKRFNVIDYTPYAIRLPGTPFIEVVISNPTGADVTIGYFIRGWGRRVF